MAVRGRPPKPVEIKRRTGNPGKRRLANPITALAPVIVVAPREAQSGHELVQSILDAGASAWVGTTDQLGLLTLLAEGWDERRRIREQLMGDPPDSLEGRALLTWFASRRKDLRDLEKQLTSWLSLLGLTPTDRSRLGVAEVRARTRLEDLRARRSARSRAG